VHLTIVKSNILVFGVFITDQIITSKFRKKYANKTNKYGVTLAVITHLFTAAKVLKVNEISMKLQSFATHIIRQSGINSYICD
jgi:hypothetical protein